MECCVIYLSHWKWIDMHTDCNNKHCFRKHKPKSKIGLKLLHLLDCSPNFLIIKICKILRNTEITVADIYIS